MKNKNNPSVCRTFPNPQRHNPNKWERLIKRREKVFKSACKYFREKYKKPSLQFEDIEAAVDACMLEHSTFIDLLKDPSDYIEKTHERLKSITRRLEIDIQKLKEIVGTMPSWEAGLYPQKEKLLKNAEEMESIVGDFKCLEFVMQQQVGGMEEIRKDPALDILLKRQQRNPNEGSLNKLICGLSQIIRHPMGGQYSGQVNWRGICVLFLYESRRMGRFPYSELFKGDKGQKWKALADEDDISDFCKIRALPKESLRKRADRWADLYKEACGKEFICEFIAKLEEEFKKADQVQK